MKQAEAMFWGVVLVFLVVGIYNDHQMRKHVIVATEQDVVRWCLDHRAAHAPQADTDYYCRDMGGNEYIAKGVKPNYDKYQSWKFWGLKEEPKP